MLKINNEVKNIKFWQYSSTGKVKINQAKLIDFLSHSGFAKVEKSDTTYVLVRYQKNTVREISEHVIINHIKKYLKRLKKDDVYETFVAGSSTYITTKKLMFLKSAKMINDRDDRNSSWFHFQNLSWQVGKANMSSILIKNFDGKIWSSRIIKKNCYVPLDNKQSQIKQFCYNISGKDENRFNSLKTIIGYLLHRNHDPANAKAIILIDENISSDDSANGGTGKSLLLQAIGKCREVVIMDGKNIKHNSWFKNQRINRTTDVVFYDDVGKDFNLEALYSQITTGIVVEKKYKDEEYIQPEESPKICISSNYIVKGTGGSTDERRRCEFEVANHYNADYGPRDEFGNYFFIDWDDDEWSRFYLFMMSCVKYYLNHGLIKPKPINIRRNRLISTTSEEFVRFSEIEIIQLDKWQSKKDLFELFVSEYPQLNYLSPHQFTKWVKEYARQNSLRYKDRKTGASYDFFLSSIKKQDKDEK